MLKKEKLKELKTHVKNDELETVLSLLEEIAIENNRFNEYISQSAQFKNLKKRINLGLISTEDQIVERNKIRFQLIEFLDELEQENIQNSRETKLDIKAKVSKEALIDGVKNFIDLLDFRYQLIVEELMVQGWDVDLIKKLRSLHIRNVKSIKVGNLQLHHEITKLIHETLKEVKSEVQVDSEKLHQKDIKVQGTITRTTDSKYLYLLVKGSKSKGEFERLYPKITNEWLMNNYKIQDDGNWTSLNKLGDQK